TAVALVALREIPPAQFERVHAELARQRIHRTLQPERPFHMSGRAEGGHCARIHVHESLRGAHIGAGVELVEDAARTAEPSAGAHGDVRVERNRRERAVTGRTECHTLNGSGPVPGVPLLAGPIVDAPHGAAEAPGEQRSDECIGARSVLGTKPAAHEILYYTHF